MHWSDSSPLRRRDEGLENRKKWKAKHEAFNESARQKDKLDIRRAISRVCSTNWLSLREGGVRYHSLVCRMSDLLAGEILLNLRLDRLKVDSRTHTSFDKHKAAPPRAVYNTYAMPPNELPFFCLLNINGCSETRAAEQRLIRSL